MMQINIKLYLKTLNTEDGFTQTEIAGWIGLSCLTTMESAGTGS